jgi:hypothetical protein
VKHRGVGVRMGEAPGGRRDEVSETGSQGERALRIGWEAASLESEEQGWLMENRPWTRETTDG